MTICLLSSLILQPSSCHAHAHTHGGLRIASHDSRETVTTEFSTVTSNKNNYLRKLQHQGYVPGQGNAVRPAQSGGGGGGGGASKSSSYPKKRSKPKHKHRVRKALLVIGAVMLVFVPIAAVAYTVIFEQGPGDEDPEFEFYDPSEMASLKRHSEFSANGGPMEIELTTNPKPRGKRPGRGRGVGRAIRNMIGRGRGRKQQGRGGPVSKPSAATTTAPGRGGGRGRAPARGGRGRGRPGRAVAGRRPANGSRPKSNGAINGHEIT
jgi:hypothetical protein